MKPRWIASLLAILSLFLPLKSFSSWSSGAGIEEQGVREEPRASARGFFQRKSQYGLKATGVRNHTGIPPGSSERDIPAFAREPALAGTWYPASPERLKGQLTEFLSQASGEPVQGEVIGLVVPHAGYMYSGQVAAFGYRHLQGTNFKRVILIGPSHHVGFKGIAVDLQSGYRTPLGTAPVDKDFVNELLGTSSQIRWVPDAFTREHSLEIQVPFLQSVLREFSIVPVLMQVSDDVTCATLAEGLSKAIRKKQGKTLILASTDLSHFHSGDKAKLLDHHFIEGLRAFDPKGLLRSMSRGECEACGGGPTVAAMLAARGLGADQAIVLRYANSGDVNGDYKRVVGYASAAFVRR